MAQLPGQGFDADQEIDDGLLPDGHYLFEIVDSEYVERTKDDGTPYSYIKLVFDQVDGDTRIWQNFTYTNPNPTAVRIGRRDFKAVCKACGLSGMVGDTSILHGRRFTGEVYTEKGEQGYADKNQINKFSSPQSAQASGAPAPPAQQQTQQSWTPPAQQQQQPAPQQQPAQQQPAQQQPAQQPAPQQQPQNDPAAPWNQ